MAFPFLGEEGFEEGNLASSSFDTETDTQGKLDFPSFVGLAQQPGLAMPFRGGFCMRVDLTIGTITTDAYVEETGTWDMAASEEQWWRFMLWLSDDLTMADGDEFIIWKIRSAAADEGVVAVDFSTANGLRLGIGETAPTSFVPGNLTTNVWHAVEVKAVLDAGGGNDGTLDLWLDGAQATQVASLDQAAVTHGRLGVMGADAGTTAGTVLFDEVITDDAQIYPPRERYPEHLLMTDSGHAFIGPGCIDNVSLLSGAGTDCVLSIFDTDVGNITDASSVRVELKNTANNELVDPAGTPIKVERGAYVSLSGTTPRALLKIGKVPTYSAGALRIYGTRRTGRPGGV